MSIALRPIDEYCRIELFQANTREIHSTLLTLQTSFSFIPNAIELVKKIKIIIEVLRLAEDAQDMRQKPTLAKITANRDISVNQLIDDIRSVAKVAKIHNFRIETIRSDQFRKIVHKVKIFAKGSLIPGAITLFHVYWPEVRGLKITFSEETKVCHLYGGFYLKYFVRWFQTDLKTQYSFENYFDTVVRLELPQKKLDKLIKLTNVGIELYVPSTSQALKVYFANGKPYQKYDAMNRWNEASFPSFESFYGYKRYEEGAFLLKDDWYMYVITTNNELYFQKKFRGSSQHSSLSGGAAVVAAGTVIIENNKIQTITRYSGHYQTTKTQLITMIEYLTQNGVDIGTFDIDISVDTLKESIIPKIDVEQWYRAQKLALFKDSTDRQKELFFKWPYRYLTVLHKAGKLTAR